jgi:hypothetical protein
MEKTIKYQDRGSLNVPEKVSFVAIALAEAAHIAKDFPVDHWVSLGDKWDVNLHTDTDGVKRAVVYRWNDGHTATSDWKTVWEKLPRDNAPKTAYGVSTDDDYRAMHFRIYRAHKIAGCHDATWGNNWMSCPHCDIQVNVIDNSKLSALTNTSGHVQRYTIFSHQDPTVLPRKRVMLMNNLESQSGKMLAEGSVGVIAYFPVTSHTWQVIGAFGDMSRDGDLLSLNSDSPFRFVDITHTLTGDPFVKEREWVWLTQHNFDESGDSKFPIIPVGAKGYIDSREGDGSIMVCFPAYEDVIIQVEESETTTAPATLSALDWRDIFVMEELEKMSRLKKDYLVYAISGFGNNNPMGSLTNLLNLASQHTRERVNDLMEGGDSQDN